MLEKHIKGSECEVVKGRHELMPEVQSSEIGPKEGQEPEMADREEDQLGHLGCVSHEEHNCTQLEGKISERRVARKQEGPFTYFGHRFSNNYQHNNDQMDEEREHSSEDPREESSSDSTIDNTNKTKQKFRLQHHVFEQRLNDLPYGGSKYPDSM